MYPAHDLGLDSIQCECSYMCTKEIIVTTKACVLPFDEGSSTSSGCAPADTRSGWNASLPCRCDPREQVLNCQ